MICIQLTPENEKRWYEHCLIAVGVKHSPPFYTAMCKAYIKAYNMQHSDELPPINNVDGDNND